MISFDVVSLSFQMKIEGNYLLPGKYSNYPDFKLVLSADNIALFVWLEVGNVRGRFSENGFHMFESRKEIVFHAHEAITAEILRDNIKITTLSDIYNLRNNDFDENYFILRREV